MRVSAKADYAVRAAAELAAAADGPVKGERLAEGFRAHLIKPVQAIDLVTAVAAAVSTGSGLRQSATRDGASENGSPSSS